MANETLDRKQATVGNIYCSLSQTLIQDIRPQLTFLSTFNIFLSITAFLGNVVILDALRKESSIRPPSKLFFRCLATTDICVGVIIGPLVVFHWISIMKDRWIYCRFLVAIVFVIGSILTQVSLLTSTAIGVDRLLALLLRLRYNREVTLKRVYAVLTAFWIISIIFGVMSSINFRAYLWFAYTVITVCLVTALFTYTKIFRTLRHHQNQTLSAFRQMTPLTLARYRNAVSSALCVQLTMVVCYLPYAVAGVVSQVLQDPGEPATSSIFLMKVYTVTLVYLNSSLNPILYCWKIASVRDAVKARVKKVLCRFKFQIDSVSYD